MIAYKFRSADQIQFALDVVYNRRLYCADWSTLNDPVEGIFALQSERDVDALAEARVEEVRSHKRRLRVASLSRTFDCHLLWAHYASGFSGLAVEVELPDDDPRIRPIKYRGVFAMLRMFETFNAEEAAKAILSSKYKEWEYEREVRIIHSDQWYDLTKPVRRIIAGHRMDRALLKGLRAICAEAQIPLCTTGIGDEGIDADRYWSPGDALT